MTQISTERPPVPPFTDCTAVEKVRMAEDAWNSKDPHRVSLAYSADSQWRNRNIFLSGRAEIVEFLTQKWRQERDYRLIKELWAYSADRIAVRFAYEWCDDQDQWVRSYGNENWRFDAHGFMTERHASINDLRITESERLFRWPSGSRPSDHKALSELGL